VSKQALSGLPNRSMSGGESGRNFQVPNRSNEIRRTKSFDVTITALVCKAGYGVDRHNARIRIPNSRTTLLA